MSNIILPSLQKGHTIGVCATSSAIEEQDLKTAQTFMEAQGYKVFLHPQATKRLHQSAGTSQEKVDALHDLFQNPDIDAIFCARGGNRASTLLPLLDFNLIKQNPKILLGYSDVTALLNAIYKQSGVTGFHGPLFRELPNHPDFDQMIGVLSGTTTQMDLSGCEILLRGAPDTASGTLLGGNLSLFQGLIGTPYIPDTTGAILLLEDTGDHLSRYDRMFCHLKNAGILTQLSALIIGDFTDIQDNTARPFGFTLKDVILEHMAGLDIPVLTNAPFGHDARLQTLPIGTTGKLCLKTSTLSFKPLS